MTKRLPDDAPRLRAKAGQGVLRKKRGVNAGGDIAAARARGIDTSTIAGAEQISPDKPLTMMQMNFVKAWAGGESIHSASIRAGYSSSEIGYRLVRMPNILRIYEQEKKAYEEAAGMTRKKVMDGLQDGIAMATLLGEPASVIAGWREVGKMCGYYEPVQVKHTVTHEGKIVLDRLNRMSDQDLLAHIAKLAETMGPVPMELIDGTEGE